MQTTTSNLGRKSGKKLKKLFSNPKNLLLIDGCGAIVSSFFLGIVLVQFEHLFGIPSRVLYLLASIPILFAIYDIYFYLNYAIKLKSKLRLIALLNISYCCLSLGLAFFHLRVITNLGWIYLVTELTIVSALATLQLIAGGKS